MQPKKNKPNIIINAAAYTNVDKAEKEKELSNLVNNVSVGEIAKFSKQNNSLFIHFSTDYVFSVYPQTMLKQMKQTL